MADDELYDVVIIGAGVCGAIIAKQLGAEGKSVLLIDAGDAIPNSREDFMERFYMDPNKYPEAPYPGSKFAPSATIDDLLNKPNGQRYLQQPDKPTSTTGTDLEKALATAQFGSTYVRRAGGTMWHWHGTSIRNFPNDFKLFSQFDRAVDWPISYEDLGSKLHEYQDLKSGGTIRKRTYYGMAEEEFGVSADRVDQEYGQPPIKIAEEDAYPNPGIPFSKVDQLFQQLDGEVWRGEQIKVRPLAAGRNSRHYEGRRACAGNTNCVPICPIQAKYDPTVTLSKAFNFPNVQKRFNHVATRLLIDSDSNKIRAVECIPYGDVRGDRVEFRAKRYVVACHAIETPKLLLNSNFRNKHIGRYLMDHPFYLKWGLTERGKPVFPYRGPVTTAGFLDLRDGKFRKERSAYRVEFANAGWALSNGDPYTTVKELVDGEGYFGAKLANRLNDNFTRQVRLGFEFEQLPRWENRVELSNGPPDAVGLKKPRVTFSLDGDEYLKKGFDDADRFAEHVFLKLNISNKTTFPFIMGAGHIMGTYRMGTTCDNSVVDREQRSWEFRNLFLVGSGVFPTGATANPTLTVAALAFWAADTITQDLKSL